MSGLINKILVPVDGTDVANQALPYARQVAQQSGAEVVLFRVVPSVGLQVTVAGLVPTFNQNYEKQITSVEEAEAWMDRIVADLGYGKIKAQAVADVGDPAQKILDYAQAGNIDLIVMSSHDRHGVASLVHTSVARKVLIDAPCSVMLVRPPILGERIETQEVEAQEVETQEEGKEAVVNS
jgi:nucleotide-binding universal stress UspA family protein